MLFSKYKYIIIPIILWFVVQIIKVIWEYFREHDLNFKRIVGGAGGVLSAHSVLVSSLATMIGKNLGIDSVEFAIAFFFAMIVMYDASGVRREAGRHAEILNKIIEKTDDSEIKSEKKLNESIGHNLLQVFLGSLLGIIVGIVI